MRTEPASIFFTFSQMKQFAAQSLGSPTVFEKPTDSFKLIPQIHARHQTDLICFENFSILEAKAQDVQFSRQPSAVQMQI